MDALHTSHTPQHVNFTVTGPVYDLNYTDHGVDIDALFST